MPLAKGSFGRVLSAAKRLTKRDRNLSFLCECFQGTVLVTFSALSCFSSCAVAEPFFSRLAAAPIAAFFSRAVDAPRAESLPAVPAFCFGLPDANRSPFDFFGSPLLAEVPRLSSENSSDHRIRYESRSLSYHSNPFVGPSCVSMLRPFVFLRDVRLVPMSLIRPVTKPREPT